MYMAIGVGFVKEECGISFEDYYQAELADSPIGAGGFVKDICYEKTVERYQIEHQSEEKEQGFI